MCVDFRLLNKLTVRLYPLPLIKILLSKASGYRYYSTIDCCQEFWQIRLDEEIS
jgi:hypothetical protein